MATPIREPVRLVVFDLDGTLIDSTADLTSAVNRTLARVAPGTAVLTQAAVRRMVGEGARVLVERALRAASSPASVDDVLPVFLAAYEACLLETTRLYPGVAEGLDRLGDRTLAVLTNKPGRFSRAILEGLGIAGRFARVYGGDEVPQRKPDPAALRTVMQDLGVIPGRTAMVGDSPIDVLTGRAASVFTVGVTYGLDPERLALAGPDALVGDLQDLPVVLP